MLIESGILLFAYGVKRFFDKKEKTPNKEQKTEVDKKISTVIAKRDSEQTPPNSHLYASYVSLAFSIARQFFLVSPAVKLIGLGLYFYTLSPVLKESENALFKEKKFDSHVLDSFLVLAALATNQYFAAAFVQMIYHLSGSIKAKTQNKSKNMLINIFDQQPDKVWVLREGVEIEMPLEAVEMGEMVMINTGEIIPVDGVIVAGMAAIDQHTLTGESQPAEKTVGDTVFAATIVRTGKIQIQVQKAGKETTVAKIGEILNNTTYYKTETQLRGEKWSDQTVVPQLVLTALLLPFIGPVSASAILNTNPGQRIKFLSSLDTLNYLNIAFHESILIKDGSSLEKLMTVDTLLFDKTGTLTQEQPDVARIVTCSDYHANEVLRYAATAEQKLSHPIARAITQRAEHLNLSLFDAEQSDYKLGYGVTITFANQVVKVGSRRFMETEDIVIPDVIQQAILDNHAQGYSLVMVAIDQRIIGMIEIQTAIRPEIKQLLAKLRQRQQIKHIVIVSGDHRHPTQHLAEELGIETYFYDVLPEDKAKIVEQLQQQGQTVCFIGDGVNDSIAMKTADVSVSLKGATTVATDLAQVVLMDGSLTHLDRLFEIAQRLDSQLNKALFFGVTPLPINIVGILFTHYGIAYTIVVNQIAFWSGLLDAMQPLKKLEAESHLVHNEKTELPLNVE